MEGPTNPLLGPTLKGLYFCGLWYDVSDSKFRKILYIIRNLFTCAFFSAQCIDFYISRHDVNKVINGISALGLEVICIAKLYSCIMWQANWEILFKEISQEEIFQKDKGTKNPIILKRMAEYTRYTRTITYIYWGTVFVTVSLMCATPFLKYMSSQNYQQEIALGQEPPPQILSFWFPFDNNNMNYLVAIFMQICMSYQGAGIIAAFDMNAVAIMSYFKGQLIILMENCNNLFEDNFFEDNIKECHRHHNVLVKQYQMYNSLVSPTMFLYVIVCSITICSVVIQFSLGETTPSQKIWFTQYTGSLVLQLFIYCWHGNEATIQSNQVDRAIYNSNWWRGDVGKRRKLLLLAGQLNYFFIFSAGPFTSLSVYTFINIIKGAYSIRTLFEET